MWAANGSDYLQFRGTSAVGMQRYVDSVKIMAPSGMRDESPAYVTKSSPQLNF